MIHQYINNGYHIVLDVNSGSVHSVDALLYDAVEVLAKIVPDMEKPMPLTDDQKKAVREALVCKYSAEDIEDALSDIQELIVPEIHEQWLHHIIVLILEPIITATSYRYSCGSFPKRGAHYGKKFIMKILKSGKGIRNFGKIDIRHFYDNIRIKVLMKELSIRIKDSWFLYIIRLCLKGFKKGIPLGFYISQWLANYILEPLDKFITEKLGLDKFVRYMDDMIFYDNAKKNLRAAIEKIKIFIGRRYRLKLKGNHQVCRFYYEGKRKIGRPLDFMGFQFYRNKVILRKSIMIAATRMAKRLAQAKAAGRGYYAKHVKSMLSYVGWFDCTDTYDCYRFYIKPFVNIGKLKRIVSKLDRRNNHYEAVERRTLQNAA